MLFLNLTVDNFGVFKGKHFFDLAPHGTDGHNSNLTIFSGHNGAGKTTLFQAMTIALHGFSHSGSLKDGQKDKDFMRSRIHGYRSTAGIDNANIVDSGVALSFQYVKSGKVSTIAIERRWKKHGQGIRETLQVLQDGQQPAIDNTEYQAWLDELIPPGFAQLCFFDAEQLDALANRDHQSAILKETLTRLLGLDWIQRLDSDLEQLMNRQGSTKKVETLYIKVLESQTARDKVDDQLSILRKELEEVSSDISGCEDALLQQDRLLTSEGGIYAAKRPVLQTRLHAVQKEVDIISNQLRDLCGGLLPFALAPELCIQLYKRLASEVELRKRQTFTVLLEDTVPMIEQLLSEDGIWEGLSISHESRRQVAHQLAERLRTFGQVQSSNDEVIVHQLSEPEHQQLRNWIAQVLHEIPQQVHSLGIQLREAKEEKRRIELDLQRAPDDDVLAPIHAEITRLQKILNDKRKRYTALTGQISLLQFQRDEKERDLQDAIEQHTKLRKLEKQLKYAERSKAIMRTYKDVLTRQKLQDLEEAVQIAFNQICRKEHLLSKVRISPEYFEVHLETVDGMPLRLSDFSAGERQLYAMSLLWALRMVSKSPLPLAIDTPLARLDEIHRTRLIEDYIPVVSDQVLLFTTDAELDENMLSQVKHQIAHIYRLHYNSERGETSVTSDNIPPYRNEELSLSVAEEGATYAV